MAFEAPMEDLSRNGTNTNTSSFLAQLYIEVIDQKAQVSKMKISHMLLA